MKNWSEIRSIKWWKFNHWTESVWQYQLKIHMSPIEISKNLVAYTNLCFEIIFVNVKVWNVFIFVFDFLYKYICALN